MSHQRRAEPSRLASEMALVWRNETKSRLIIASHPLGTGATTVSYILADSMFELAYRNSGWGQLPVPGVDANAVYVLGCAGPHRCGGLGARVSGKSLRVIVLVGVCGKSVWEV